MGKISAIGWTDSTFNPWWGCEKVSPGCDHCYAEAWAARAGYPEVWSGKYRLFGDKHWNEPRKWNRKAEKAGKPLKVFCGSMCDILDNKVPGGSALRARLWQLAEDTPWLHWQFLTKRIGNADRMLPQRWIKEGLPRHIWFGISVVNQEEADRDIPKLLRIPTAVPWVSYEPALGPVDLGMIGRSLITPHIAWIVVGGESGPRARPFDLKWARDTIRQGEAAQVPIFVKQLGSNPFDGGLQSCEGPLGNCVAHDYAKFRLSDSKGTDPSEWPQDTRVREFPDEVIYPPFLEPKTIVL